LAHLWAIRQKSNFVQYFPEKRSVSYDPRSTVITSVM